MVLRKQNHFLYVLLVSLSQLFTFHSTAQSPILSVTNSFDQQAILYNTDTFMHTAWRPVIYIDSAYIKSNRKWLHRKFFEEHLLQLQQPQFNIFADIVVDEYIGKGNRSIPTWRNNTDESTIAVMNTRGYEIKGNIGEKFYFETALYENQARFPGYVDSIIRRDTVIPFQSRFKNIGDGKGFDFSYSTARLIYMPGKHFLFDLGFGTNFIGDGYRSLLLSDYNTSYPYLRAAYNFGQFQYSVMWSQYIGETKKNIYAFGYPRKWGQTYLLDWQATKKISIGLFNTVMSPYNTSDNRINLSISQFSPVMFLHAYGSSKIESNDMAGLNIKFRATKKINIYGQFLADQFGSDEWKNRYGLQLGARAGDLFSVKGWNALAEVNLVRPYTYASDKSTTVYAHNNQPLAHPNGANFKEVLFVTDYTYKRWWFRLEAFANRYGADSSVQADYGQNIFKPLLQRSKEDNIKTSQGLYTSLYYGDLRFAYILNNKTNLRIESGFTLRSESNKTYNYKDVFFYIGIRTTFRKLIYDF